MKKTIHYAGALFFLATLNISTTFAQGTAFTYQGRLGNNGAPANGSYDLLFSVYNVSSNGVIFAGPLTNSATAVSNGLFTVTLDFGPGVFTGPPYWLDISVRTNGGAAFTELSPRQQILPTPYAIMANSASNLLGTLPAAQLTGQIPAGQLSGTIGSSNLSGTYNQPVTFNNGQNQFYGDFFGSFFGSTFQGGTFTGQFLGDGSGLVNLNPTHFNSGPIAFLNSNQVFTAQNVFMQPVGFGQPNPSPAYEIDVLGSQGSERFVTTNTAYGSVLELRSLLAIPNEYLGAVNFNNAANVNPGQIGYIQANPANQNLDYMEFRVGGSTAFTIQADPRGALAANIIGGFPGNSISTLVDGSDVIAGGGYPGIPNIIYSNTAGAFIGAGSGNQAGPNVLDAVIVGGYENMNQSTRAAIGGGYQNMIQPASDFSIIGDGNNNLIQSGAYGSVIAGGQNNTIGTNAEFSVIGGGLQNYIQTNAYESFIGSGYGNTIESNSADSFIGGGAYETIQTNADLSFIGGGYYNQIGSLSSYAAIAGGDNNTIGYNTSHAFIGGGYINTIQTNADYAVIGGGYINQIDSLSSSAVIAGGDFNLIAYNTSHAFIGSGDGNSIGFYSGFSAIPGGIQNTIETNAGDSFIGAGAYNRIQADSGSSVIGGGSGNTIEPVADHATIAGGFNNSIQTNSWDSFIGGGFGNVIEPFAVFATIAGGQVNAIQGDYSYTTNYNTYSAAIGGGFFNQILTNSPYATIVGGTSNQILPNAYGAAIGGGNNNMAGGANSAVPGGSGNLAGGIQSFAAGTDAQATNDGAFVLADYETNNFYSTVSNQFSARFIGGIRFVTAGAGMTLDGQPILSGTVNPGQLSGVYSNAVIMTNAGNIFAGNGTRLTNVNAALLNGLPSSAFAPASGSTNYIQNQILGIQNASFQISGSALVGGAVSASTLVTPSIISSNITASGTVAANNVVVTNNLQINGGTFQVLGAGSNTLTTAFVQWSTAGNIVGDHTIINNPICNGDPNAILIVTHNFNPGNTPVTAGWNHVVGTYYNVGQWTIYNEDLSVMSSNVAFNVLVIKH